ncbi:putative major pilin subunit [Clostridium perfringens]|uniref:prepilin-type N-terminal cleavage/methylation domain-containing protein n=1 Tax=Clostridium perfringens TaxID=1502 RepID=UPI001A2B9F42|nr:prepilin-type N-terminal cleavage/methylation domain-containing protein [Clostridium perfringens]MDG6878897.1 putative major pilin subunit [Clostridium perfringens]HAT4226226.1 prepilin-type N-terminal cleavage/methylation domain-containing protein [Clostridium perfringens]HBI7032301.1 prepilin-type N-terminal cleavage/methylation domain-containing protein [Clostridium perfringens]HBI7046787.1 prepilin-type N-terminal cleavage/methylation domain-containing protein [Clostridium perfringens]H
MSLSKENRKKKGFTLIELIIVIAIIAILAAIAIPNFLGIQRKSKIKADIASAKTIYDATSAAIAEGAINPEVDGQNGKFHLTPGAKLNDTDIAIKAIENRLQTIPTGKYTPGNFIVTITKGDGAVKPSIEVSIEKSENDIVNVYPEAGNNEYKINSLDGKSN